MSRLSHINSQGRAKMVDVTDKNETHRSAEAVSSVSMNDDAYQAVVGGHIKKGDVLSVAQVAGIMAAKNTSQIIPMCHPLSLTGVNIHFDWNHDERTLMIHAVVKTKGQTGVEMEALTAASSAALTVYDMCKALDKGMIIGPTYLQHKTGGKSGDYHRETSHVDERQGGQAIDE